MQRKLFLSRSTIDPELWIDMLEMIGIDETAGIRFVEIPVDPDEIKINGVSRNAEG